MVQRLDRNKAHVRSGDGFTDCCGIGGICLVPLHIGLDVLRRDEPHQMSKAGEFACPVVGSRTGLQANNARRKLGEIRHQLVPGQTAAQRWPPCIIDAVYLKDGFCEVETYGRDGGHGSSTFGWWKPPTLRQGSKWGWSMPSRGPFSGPVI